MRGKMCRYFGYVGCPNLLNKCGFILGLMLLWVIGCASPTQKDEAKAPDSTQVCVAAEKDSIAEPDDSILAQSQHDEFLFDEFLNRFPTLTWDKLDSLRMIRDSDLINSNTIPIELANYNIWDRTSRERYECWGEVYHNGEPTFCKVGAAPTPLVKLTQGRYRRYMNAYMGIFYSTEGVKYDEETEEWIPSGEYNKVYPLAKINLYDDVVMLIVGYKYFHEIAFNFSQEIYLFKKSTQQFISSFCLSGDNPARTIMYDCQRISSYEWEERMDEDVVYHYVYKIGEDGFLEEVEDYGKVELLKGYISDKDGFVNVRQNPSTNAKILYTIPDETEVLYYLLPKSQWAEIHTVYDKSKNAKIGGFVHISKIVKVDRLYGYWYGY